MGSSCFGLDSAGRFDAYAAVLSGYFYLFFFGDFDWNRHVSDLQSF